MAPKSATKIEPVQPELQPVPVRSVANIASDFEEFTSDEQYQSDIESFPWIQVLNKEDEIDRAGFFVTDENAERAGLTPDDRWIRFGKRFGASDRLEGWRTVSPAFCIIAQSPLYLKPRKKEDKRIILFEAEKYDKQIFTTLVRYLLIFLDNNNNPLHYTPLQFTAKGSVGGSFAAEIKKLRQQIDVVTKKPMNGKFYALWRFCLSLDTKIMGEGTESSWVTTVAGHEPFTAENHSQYFFGRDAEKRLLMETLVDQNKDYGQPRAVQPTNSVPESQSEQDFGDFDESMPTDLLADSFDPNYDDIPL